MKDPAKLSLAILVLLLPMNDVCPADHNPEPLIFGLPPSALRHASARADAGDKGFMVARRRLIKDARLALTLKPISVMDKPKAGASGNKHDYFSTAPYFWPDPAKPDGLPYIRRDGSKNPESHNDASDSPRMARMAGTACTLALAYHFSRDEAFAQKASQHLRVWFFDPATKMNPNFDYAQAIPGVNTGRGIGMIESRSLTSVMDAAGLLTGSEHWTRLDQTGLVTWVKEFLNWSQTSRNGRAERLAKNNHGSFYDMQTAHMALFTGQRELAEQIIQSAKTNRIDHQFKADGSQPLELAREDSFGYSRFSLEALFDLATLGEHLQIDLWHYTSPNGAGLKKGLDFLLPYAEDAKMKWPFEHEKHPNRDLRSLLRRAWLVYQDERYLKLLRKRPSESEREDLFYPYADSN